MIAGLKKQEVIHEYRKDRYDSTLFVENWIEAEKNSRVIVLDDIEIEGYEKKYEGMVLSFLRNISDIDNTVQQFCERAFKESHQHIKNFIVDLSWVSLKDGKVNLGYVGRFVNIELRAACVLKDDVWTVEDMYFQ